MEGKTETGVATASPTPGRTPPAVKTVLVFPGSLTLTIPARDASRSLGLPAWTTVTALAQFADGTSTDSVSWSASSGVVSVSGSGVVTALATGTAVITATSVATPSASGTASVTVDDSGALDLTLN